MKTSAAAVGALDAVAGAGLPSRRIEALEAIEEIVDPCSQALGCPIGLVGMGMVATLAERDGDVEVEILPTFPTCMFRGVIEEGAIFDTVPAPGGGPEEGAPAAYEAFEYEAGPFQPIQESQADPGPPADRSRMTGF